MPRTIIIEKSITINAPIDAVWKISAVEFEHIDRWDGNVQISQTSGSPSIGAPTGGRVCDMYNGGKTVERFIEFDENKHTFAYEITEGLPGFVISAQNIWTHDTLTRNKTKLTMRVIMQVKGLLGFIMQGPMKSQMGKVLDKAQEELKYYVEKGQPHPRKQKKMKRA